MKTVLNKCHATDASKTGSLMPVDFPHNMSLQKKEKSDAKDAATRSHEAQMQQMKHSRTPTLDANAFLEHTRSQRTKQRQTPRPASDSNPNAQHPPIKLDAAQRTACPGTPWPTPLSSASHHAPPQPPTPPSGTATRRTSAPAERKAARSPP